MQTLDYHNFLGIFYSDVEKTFDVQFIGIGLTAIH